MHSPRTLRLRPHPCLLYTSSLAQHLVENRVERVALVPTSKALTFFQNFEERGSIVSVYVDLLVALELCAVCKLAELMLSLIHIFVCISL